MVTWLVYLCCHGIGFASKSLWPHHIKNQYIKDKLEFNIKGWLLWRQQNDVLWYFHFWLKDCWAYFCFSLELFLFYCFCSLLYLATGCGKAPDPCAMRVHLISMDEVVRLIFSACRLLASMAGSVLSSFSVVPGLLSHLFSDVSVFAVWGACAARWFCGSMVQRSETWYQVVLGLCWLHQNKRSLELWETTSLKLHHASFWRIQLNSLSVCFVWLIVCLSSLLVYFGFHI